MDAGSVRATEDGEFCWGELVARVLHPAQVEIIEALRWISQSLSAADLLEVFEGQLTKSHIEYRLRQLARLDAVTPEEDVQGPRSAERFSYCLVRHHRQ
jgi:hypothetical protein